MKGLPAIVFLAMYTALGGSPDPAVLSGPAGQNSFGAAGFMIEKLGLVTALVIAVLHSTKRADKKEEELERREKAYHEALQKKDEAINAILVTVVKGNTESLTRFQEQSKDMVAIMGKVTDRLGDFTEAIKGMQGNCMAIRPPHPHQEPSPGFIRNTPP